jgi:hypothetical protein
MILNGAARGGNGEGQPARSARRQDARARMRATTTPSASCIRPTRAAISRREEALASKRKRVADPSRIRVVSRRQRSSTRRAASGTSYSPNRRTQRLLRLREPELPARLVCCPNRRAATAPNEHRALPGSACASGLRGVSKGRPVGGRSKPRPQGVLLGLDSRTIYYRGAALTERDGYEHGVPCVVASAQPA